MNDSFKTYTKMLQYLVPYLSIFIIASLVSLIVVALDGASYWFLGSLVKTLFIPDPTVLQKPELSLGTLNLFLKYYTYQLLFASAIANPLSILCFVIVMVYTAKNILAYVNSLVLQWINLSIVKDIRNKLYNHALLLPVSYYDRNRSGTIVSLIVNDISQINSSMTNTLSTLVMESFRLLLFIGMLFAINCKLTLIVFAVYIFFGYGITTLGKAVKRRSKRMLDTFSDLMSLLTETVNNIRVVKMFSMHRLESEKFKRENSKLCRNTFRSERLRLLVSPFTELLFMYVTAILLWYGGQGVIAGTSQFTAEDFMRFLLFLVAIYQPFKSLANIYNTIQTGIAAAERVFSLMERRTEPLNYETNTSAIQFSDSIEFKNVSFTYPESEQQVLTNISVTIRKCHVCAIVGSSGAGKSTLLDLIARFYDVTKGSICIDGIDIQKYDLHVLRELFGIVSQETILFHDSIRNNISYGTNNASLEQITQAAEAAQAMEFINRMPEGLDTIIGERGVTLSGGQRQRLSIARALLRNPEILILDEATSSLDTESEILVQKAINNLIKNRTVLVVAHRLSTVQHADLIVVLEHGTIVETGTHEQLMKVQGKYRYFHDIQFSHTNQGS